LKSSYLQNRTLYPPLINIEPNKKLSVIIIIPAFNEPDLKLTLNSLLQNDPTAIVEVIICVNYAENTSDAVKKTSKAQHNKLVAWSKGINTEKISFHPILLKNLPNKKAGVGYARKVAMDEAAYRFQLINNKKGVIVNLDADCLVSENYVNAISTFFNVNENCKAANIYYEHIADNESPLSEGIILYELHLRYIVEALKYCKYPYAYHTVGSSFCVNTMVYQQQGGMNLRKAGEDFYFLHKVFPLGYFGEIADAVVYPSSRSSDRVPFGTGKSIADWQNQKRDLNYSYNLKIFEIVKTLFKNPMMFYEEENYKTVVPETLSSFLATQNFEEVLSEIKNNTNGADAFVKRYYRYWSGFKLWKLIHYLRDNYFENTLLMNSCSDILNFNGISTINTGFEMLTTFRAAQKKASYHII